MERPNNDVACPIRNCMVVLPNLDAVRQHLHDHAQHEHPIFVCKVPRCLNFYRTFRGWADHIQQHVNAGNQIPAGGDNLHNVHNELNHDEQVDIHLNLEAQRLLADDGAEVNANDNSSEESDLDDEDLNDLDTLPDGSKDMKHAVAKMIVSMRSGSAMSRAGTRKAMLGADLVMRVNNSNLKSKVSRYLTAVGVAGQPRAVNLLKKFDSVRPLSVMSSKKGQISSVKTFYPYIQPETVYINNRLDQRPRQDGGGQVPVPNTYEYVSIKEILRMVAGKRSLMEYVSSLQPSDDGVLRCFTDGNLYRRLPFFQQHPNAFQLVLYYDGVDPARGLGPKSGLHEIGHFLIEILNMPPTFNSSLGALHSVVLANALDCKGTFEAVLSKFVEEVKELENGVNMLINGEFTDIWATLVAVKGDAKALHELMGFLGCGATFFCHLCMISRQELHDGQPILGMLRTPASIDDDLQEVERNVNHSSRCGLRYRPCLHGIESFHSGNVKATDLMHDGPHGVMMMLIRLCLRQFICVEQLFDVPELNRRIDAFNYGRQDSKDRPTSNFTLPSLRQANEVYTQKSNAAQTLVLFRALPFILDNIGENDGVSDDNEYLQYYLLFSKIWKIVTAYEIPRDVLPYLRQLLQTFHRDWYNLFPNINPINKFHHFMHAADNIEEMGPLRQFWCFRDEGKNCPIRRHISSTNSFRNPNKTSLEQNQIHQAGFWGPHNKDVLAIEVKLCKREQATVCSLPVAQLLQDIGFAPDYVIPIAEVAFLKGFEYRIGEFILHTKASETESHLPQFARIVTVIAPENGVVWLGAQAWRTDGLVERFNAYSVSLPCNAAVHLIDVKDLPCHPQSVGGEITPLMLLTCALSKTFIN